MNKDLAKKSELYLNLLKAEWFYVATKSTERRMSEIRNYVEDKEGSLDMESEPSITDFNDYHEFSPWLSILISLLFLALVPAGGLLAWWLGWIAWDDNSILEKIVCCVIGGVVALFGLYMFIAVLVNMFKDMAHNRKVLRGMSKDEYFRKATEEWKLACDNLGKKKEAIQKTVKESNRLLGDLKKRHKVLDQAYKHSLNFLYPKYREIVCVCQFTQYLESERCEELGGPNGCYNLFETELRLNLIVNLLNDIRDTQVEALGVLKSINDLARSIKKDTASISMDTKMMALAMDEIADKVSDVNESVKNVGSSVDSFDNYYRRYGTK